MAKNFFPEALFYMSGLGRDVALQIVCGVAKLAVESGKKHLAQLREAVTSWGGTTIAGTGKASNSRRANRFKQ